MSASPKTTSDSKAATSTTEVSASKAEMVKVSLNLTKQDADTVAKIANETSYSKTDVIRRAIRIEDILLSHMKKGGEILLRNPDGTVQTMMIT